MAEKLKQYAIDFYAGERGNILTARFMDVNGNPIANKQIQLVYNDRIYERITNDEGYFYLQINWPNANKFYDLIMIFRGDQTYDETIKVIKIDLVKKSTSISAKNTAYKVKTKTKKLTVTLKTIVGSSHDGKKYLKEGKKLTLKVNGKTYTAKTNSKGKATFKITKLTKKGKFVANVKFAGDKTYKSSSKKIVITVK